MINLFRRYGFNGWLCGLLAVAVLTSLALLRLGHTQTGPVELIGRRTLTSKTFRNPDGSQTLKAYAGPIHYYDPSGRLQDLNLNLRSYLFGDYTYLADGIPHRV
ncbi:MAG: hypothetical protein HYR55_16470 [Acidobacteria bacterium]|nr:hypothetical protein [Acidobacteriota bacterium]